MSRTVSDEILRHLYFLYGQPDERTFSRPVSQALGLPHDQFREQCVELAAEELVTVPGQERGELGFRIAITAEGIRTAEVRGLIDMDEVDRRRAAFDQLLHHMMDTWKASSFRNLGTEEVIDAGGGDPTARRAFLDLKDQGLIHEPTAINGRWGISDAGRRLYLEKKRREARAERAKSMPPIAAHGYKYDVAISFAGEQRIWARELADELISYGARVFYDEYEEDLWGDNLPERFHDAFSNGARYCVIFVSREYASKQWTRFELRSAIQRSIKQIGKAYILPIQVHDIELPGLHTTSGHVEIGLGIHNIA
jgi:hypothetical protein